MKRVVAVVLLGVTCAGCAGPTSPSVPRDSSGGDVSPSQGAWRVAEVVDGDTIDVRDRDGTRIRVRLLGIDTPEVGHGSQPAACRGGAAREHLRAIAATGSAVQLAQDGKSEAKDRYGRRLAYVEGDWADLGRAMVAAGYAQAWAPASATRPARLTEYSAAQQDSRSAGRGAWAHCDRLGR